MKTTIIAAAIAFCLFSVNGNPVRNRSRNPRPQWRGGKVEELSDTGLLHYPEEEDVAEEKPDENSRVFHDYFDQRQAGEHNCDPKSFRETVYGAGLMAHSWNPLDPVEPMGDKVVDISLVSSGDCSTWVPVGFNVQRTKTSNAGIQSTESSSLRKTKDTRAFKATSAIGAATSKFSASVETSLTGRSELESSVQEKRRHYATWIESVDNTITFSKINPPPLAPEFKRRLLEYNENTDVNTFVLALLRDYSHYLYRAELGSRLSEIRSMSEKTVSEASREDSSFDVKASVRALFVTASAGYGESQSHSEATQNFDSNSTVNRYVTGEKPNMGSLTFDIATKPGVLDADYRPICELIPKNMTTLRRKCFEVSKSKAFCYTQFPEWEAGVEDVELLKQYFILMRQFEQCSEEEPPMFGFKIIGSRERSNVTLRDCALSCVMNASCKSWHFRSAPISSGYGVIGGMAHVGFCGICAGYSSSDCHKVQTCAAHEKCVTVMNYRLFDPMVQGSHTGEFTFLPQLIPRSALVVGEVLGEEKYHVVWTERNNERDICSLRMIWQHVARHGGMVNDIQTVKDMQAGSFARVITTRHIYLQEDQNADETNEKLSAYENCVNLCKRTAECNTVQLSMKVPFEDYNIDPMNDYTYTDEIKDWYDTCRHPDKREVTAVFETTCRLFNRDSIFYVQGKRLPICNSKPLVCNLAGSALSDVAHNRWE